jgi:hypothetical protein
MVELQGARWFGCRSLLQWPDTPTEKESYEERITIWRAESLEQAIAMAEIESAAYAEENRLVDVGLTQAYEMDGGNGAEVFSLIRDSELLPDECIDTLFDTGDERQRHLT